MPRSSSRSRPSARLRAWHEQFVRLAGTIHGVLVEVSDRPEKIDHLWIDLEAGTEGLFRLSLNTCSRQSRAAGFDPRVRMGTVVSPWDNLPPAGLVRAEPLDYAALEATNPIRYRAYPRQALERILLQKIRRAIFAEAWGALHAHGRAGLHQIHSRRASFAVAREIIGRDGALQLYQPDQTRELLLFKFDGQP